MKININGKYEAMANYVILRRRKDGVIIARNALIDEEIDFTEKQARYLTKLNGNCNPKKVPGFSSEECDRYYHLMDDMLMLRTPGRIQSLGSTKMYTLFIPQKLRRTKSFIPKILNFLLYTSCIPVFITGIVNFMDSEAICNYAHIWLGNLVGLLIGVVAHELSHANSCLSYNGTWMELGVMWSGIFPGAYVMIDDSRIKKKLQKVQINLAGIEMNLLLAGVFLTLSSSRLVQQSMFEEFAGAFYYAGFQNVFLALINITFYEGFDGEHAISILLGKSSVVEDAKKSIAILLDYGKGKKYWQERGITNGMANICTGAIILCSQLILPLVIFSEFAILAGEVFGW